MILYVKKSHIGQYIRPLSKVGIRSRFNLAAISFPLSPELGKRIISQRLNQHTHTQKASDEAIKLNVPLKFLRTNLPFNNITRTFETRGL